MHVFALDSWSDQQPCVVTHVAATEAACMLYNKLPACLYHQGRPKASSQIPVLHALSSDHSHQRHCL